ncbi:GNAT family N-acetyltransferase [Muricauda sp. SCSIO 64092]|uniref:GNAT family N-acetyltransferase n=1 Tax=Allomuricauda sp. SCSIO 64092 TaxID=2908842 RepID=UPI001FF1E656|nr:GNAT family N-acetyltransferase [Muricauda sp. SCSIO 64092]UOY07993.1 GNAT family N-acetyltransferase [Muricauda sp. SCSIO 64092]
MEDFQFNTARLRLLPFILEDSKAFQLLNNDAFIRKFLWDDERIDAIMADEIMEQNLRHFEEDQYGLWKIQLRGKGRTIGYVGLWHFFDEPQPQLIYALLEPHTKKGYATEASWLIVNYALEQLGFAYLTAATDEPHLASQRVAQRLGMSFVEKRIEDNRPTLFYKIEKCTA